MRIIYIYLNININVKQKSMRNQGGMEVNGGIDPTKWKPPHLCTSRLEHNTHLKGVAEDHGPLCILKRGAWWAARLCSSILLILPSAERSVSVGDGETMEVISLISVPPLWLVILLMFISEKSHGLCLAVSASLCHLLSAGLYLHAALQRPCCSAAVQHTGSHRNSKMFKTHTQESLNKDSDIVLQVII